MAKTSSVNAAGIFEPFSIEEVPWEGSSRGERFDLRYRRLGKFGGGSHVGVSIEILPPGKQSNLTHYHLLEEEHILVLEGVATLQLGDQTYELTAGDYVCFPAGQKAGHSLTNHSAEPCRFLMIGENNSSDVCVYTDTGRVGVRLTGEGYRKSATMDYWEGES